MFEIILHPLKGIDIVGLGDILLGENIESAKEKLGEPMDLFNSQYAFHNYEFKVDTNTENNITFIECLAGRNSIKTKPIIYDIEIFSLKADELLRFLSKKSSNNYFIPPEGDLYIFDDISVGIYREFIYERYKESIELAKINGEYEDHKEDWLQTLKESEYFQTLGIGIKNYYHEVIKNSTERYYG